MGTRADFYVGRGLEAEWLGSIGWDGYPNGIDEAVLTQVEETSYREKVEDFFRTRDDVTTPEMGWPWPWKDSHTTDFAYAFDEGVVYASYFGRAWFEATTDPGEDYSEGPKVVVFPDMTAIQNVVLGNRSGTISFGIGNL